MIFFFSSRRRHTRWPRDWSSDVCSSDLKVKNYPLLSMGGYKGGLVLEQKSSRLKPHGMLASRSIGRMEGDREPNGLEMYFDGVLAGQSGERYVQRIARSVE